MKTTSSVVLFSALIFSLVISQHYAEAHINISAVFAFGDSTIDPGNNNYVPTWFRSNHPPYGLGFPDRVATGRFSDGKLMTDFLVSSLGIKDLLPAYFDPNVSDHDLLTGVSFASAGSGFDSSTALIAGGATSMSNQLELFVECTDRIINLTGIEATNRVVKDAVYVISAGTNDLLLNFYDLPLKRKTHTIASYQDFLLEQLYYFIEKIYNFGGRKIAVAGLPPIGCLPLQMTLGVLLPGSHMRVCVQQQNQEAVVYNGKLQNLLSGIRSSLPEINLAYLDTYDALLNMIIMPEEYGLTNSWRGCCGLGTIEMGPLCTGHSAICQDPSKFVFWDAIHPTQATHQQLANLTLNALLPQLNS